MSETTETCWWTVADLEVAYRPELDGAGTRLGPAFADCVRRHATKPRYEHAFEWCAGPGFIGFTLLARGIVDRLTLCDINPVAIDHVAHTVATQGLQDRVRYAVGADLSPLDHAERFDLVVANPPNFYALNPRHPRYAALHADLRPNDPEWRAHQAFYAGIAHFLTADAQLFISEVNPDDQAVFLPPDEPEPYDLRPRPATVDFQRMITAGGLELVGYEDYYLGRDGARLMMMISRPATPAAA